MSDTEIPLEAAEELREQMEKPKTFQSDRARLKESQRTIWKDGETVDPVPTSRDELKMAGA